MIGLAVSPNAHQQIRQWWLSGAALDVAVNLIKERCNGAFVLNLCIDMFSLVAFCCPRVDCPLTLIASQTVSQIRPLPDSSLTVAT